MSFVMLGFSFELSRLNMREVLITESFGDLYRQPTQDLTIFLFVSETGCVWKENKTIKQRHFSCYLLSHSLLIESCHTSRYRTFFQELRVICGRMNEP
jgi:TorA maturation chaperone TorD